MPENKKATAKILDMTNVKEGGRSFNTKQIPEGDYLARVTKVADTEVKNGENKGRFQWLFTIVPDKFPTAAYPYYCQLEENQLWKIRNLMIAAGINVPKKKLKLDPEKLVGKIIAVTMEDDEYEGKMKSTIGAIFPPSEMEGSADDGDDEDDEDDEEEEEEAPPARKKKAKPVVEEEEDEEDEEEEEPEPAPKAKKKKKAAPVVEEDDDEEEEEEEEAPKPKAKKKKKVTDEELEELDIEDV